MIEHPFDVSTQFVQLFCTDDAFEYVESELPVRVQNISVKFSIPTHANGSAITENLSTFDSFSKVCPHRVSMLGRGKDRAGCHVVHLSSVLS